METAAVHGILGLDPLHYVHCRDSTEILLMDRIAEKMQEYRKVDQENLATAIANKVSKLFEK